MTTYSDEIRLIIDEDIITDEKIKSIYYDIIKYYNGFYMYDDKLLYDKIKNDWLLDHNINLQTQSNIEIISILLTLNKPEILRYNKTNQDLRNKQRVENYAAVICCLSISLWIVGLVIKSQI
jgi:hypothetical protein